MKELKELLREEYGCSICKHSKDMLCINCKLDFSLTDEIESKIKEIVKNENI